MLAVTGRLAHTAYLADDEELFCGMHISKHEQQELERKKEVL
jgi:hypothetical protein